MMILRALLQGISVAQQRELDRKAKEAVIEQETNMRVREAELTSFYEREEGYHDDEQALIEDDHFKTFGF